MARAYFPCSECGTEVAVSDRNRASADRLAKWHEEQGHLCAACQAKRYAAENQEAAEANQKSGLPALTGSEKAVAWAETLRQNRLCWLERLRPYLEMIGDQDQVEDGPEDERESLKRRLNERLQAEPSSERHLVQEGAVVLAAILRRLERFEAFREILCAQTRASWWIDNKDVTLRQLAQRLEGEINDRLLFTVPKTPEGQAMAAAAEAEALLKPKEAKSQQIAEISFFAPYLKVHFREKREDFRLKMRDMGFSWAETHWARYLWQFAGNPVDRMAEVASSLLAAGFMVRLYDAEAREKAIHGTYEPEQQRWITVAVTGKFDGWCQVRWPKKEDFYDAARSLPGSRYHEGHVYVPASSIVEAADFAGKYAFSLSPKSLALLEAHRALLAQGSVVQAPKAPEKKRLPEPSRGPARLEAPQDAGLDESLRDE